MREAELQPKERRRLVLLPRETPLHLGHLRAMSAAMIDQLAARPSTCSIAESRRRPKRGRHR